MALDLLIRGGTVIDGTGAPERRANLGIRDGRIVEIGHVGESAKRTIDADGLIVAPGFVDPHTHYDAQIWWDPQLSCSSWHGVTSVVMGNCGVGLAPCRPADRESVAYDLVNVEGIPFDVLKQGIPWDWTTFPEFMAAAERRGLGLNVGFLVPLTPLRQFVLGEAATKRAATPEETLQISELLREAIEAGALGFSTTTLSQHVGYEGRPLGCRLASVEELGAYAEVLGECGRGSIELALTEQVSLPSDDELALLEHLLDRGGRPVTWLALLDRNDQPDACRESLARAAPLIERGAVPQITCRPATAQFNLRKPFLFASFECFGNAFNRSTRDQSALYQDPGFRETFRKEIGPGKLFGGDWEQIAVWTVAKPELRAFAGRPIAEIAAERNTDGVDTFFDIALEDDLQTEFTATLFNSNIERLGELVADPRTLIGLSDGGAHVDMLCDAGYPTYLLGTWVRERKLMSLERAVKRITSEPASFFGLRDRGILAVGMAADVTIFDAERIGSGNRPETRTDLPGGGLRLVMPAHGVHYTIVNGTVLYEAGRYSGELPGRVLRGDLPD
jgi:N-acyl-D-aspartate/D-glutamate deacylase